MSRQFSIQNCTSCILHKKRKVSVNIFYHGIYGISLVVMLHGEHVAVLRNDLLVRDSAVVDRDGWNHVRV